MALAPVVGIEIGTTKTIALVGEWRDDGAIMITGVGERASTGVRKGEVIDFENAAHCVKSVLEMAEKRSQVAIHEVLLAVSGAHLQGMINAGTVPVFDKGGEITREDVEEVLTVARAVSLPPEREVLHTIAQYFYIDQEARVINPEGMEGAQLSVNMLVIHGVRTRLNNTVRVVRAAPVDVRDVAFGGLCAALAVLTPEQKKSGVVVIDLGGGTTDYVVYAEGVVASVGVVAVGGDHITNDIAMAFNIPTAQAELLKQDHGTVDLKAPGPGDVVVLPPEGGFPGRQVPVSALATVIHARLDELMTMLRRRLDKEDVRHHLGAGIVLTGGVARTPGLAALVESVFGLPCSIGRPRTVSGLITSASGPEYAAVAGLVQYGFKAGGDRARSSSWPGWLGRWISRST